MGQADGGIHLVENIDDVRNLSVRNPGQAAYVSQTTLSMDDTARIISALQARFPTSPGRERTTSVMPPKTARMRSSNWPRRAMCCSWVGSPNSSNSNRLREIARLRGVPSHLIDGPDEIQPDGSKEKNRPVSPPAPRRPNRWWPQWSNGLAEMSTKSSN